MRLSGNGQRSFSPVSSSTLQCPHDWHEVRASQERSPLLANKDGGSNIGDEDDGSLGSSSKVRARMIIAIISCASFLNIFTAQSTIIMLPTISAAFNIPTQHQPLVASIYNVSSGCFILLWARLADIHGRRLVFLLGSAAYTFTSVLLPFSPSANILFIARALQGMSVAAVIPSSIGILTSTFPEGPSRNAAFVVMNAAASLGAVLGHVVGGIIGAYLSWRWVFWLAAIFGGMITLGGFTVFDVKHKSSEQELLKDCSGLPRPEKAYVDWTGGVLITASLGILTSALSFTNGQAAIWSTVQAAVSLVLAILFILRQRRLERFTDTPPLIRMSIFKRRGFVAALITYACFLASFNSFLIYVSFFFQQYQHLPILDATWRFIPSGASCFLLAPLLPPLLLRYSHYRLLLLACLALLVSPLLLALPIPPSASYFSYVFPALILTCSVELFSPIISLFVVRCLERGDQSLGGGLLQTANNMGKALGLAIAGGARVVVNVNGDGSSDEEALRGLRAAQWVNVVLAVLTMMVAARSLKGLKSESEGQEDEGTD